MEKIVYRRTFNLGDYESLSFEVIKEHSDLNIARLLAAQECLELIKAELIRIYNVKMPFDGDTKIYFGINWERVNNELNGIQQELNNQ